MPLRIPSSPQDSGKVVKSYAILRRRASGILLPNTNVKLRVRMPKTRAQTYLKLIPLARDSERRYSRFETSQFFLDTSNLTSPNPTRPHIFFTNMGAAVQHR